MGIWRDRLRARVTQPIDNRLWRFWQGDTQRYRIHHRFHGDAISQYEPQLNLEVLRERDPRIHDHIVHRYTEYAYEFTFPLTIEPRRAWLIPRPFRVLEQSFPLVNDPWDGVKPRPSTLHYLGRRPSLVLEKAIVVSYAWHNYYHFFIDALPQLALLDALGVSRDIPIVVPARFATTKFVQDFRQMSSFLQDRTFVLQQATGSIRVAEATFVAKDVFFSPAIFRILDTIPLGTTQAQSERIFLRRDPAGPRSLSNDAEITRIAEERGYRIVDSAGLSLRDQIEIFRGAGVLVGLHGAGLTNIIFRRGLPLRLLEISPADLGSTHYRSLCKQFGYDYTRITGSYLDGHRRFMLSTDTFIHALDELERSTLTMPQRSQPPSNA